VFGLRVQAKNTSFSGLDPTAMMYQPIIQHCFGTLPYYFSLSMSEFGSP